MKFIRRFLVNRALFVSLIILIQLLVLIGVVLKFSDYFIYFYGISILISIVSVLLIINSKSNPAYKIAWMIPILLFPILGGLLYVFFGRNKLSKKEKARMKCIEDKMRQALSPHELILDEVKFENEDATNQSKYIQNYAYAPIYNNTVTEYLPIGEAKFEKLKEELRNAQHYIFLEYFIIEEGVMWNSILDILVEKVSMGVDVRVIYDDIGCLLTLPYRYDKKLEKMGIKCCIFNPLVPKFSMMLNNRDHRKIAIIDGHTAFTGGINLADEYINEINKHGHWKDTAIMFKGDAVWSMTVIFLSMWDYLRKVDEDFTMFKKDIQKYNTNNGQGYVQPFADNPLDDETVGETVYLNIINKAKRYVYITTPYLIIGNEIVTALSSAAKGGVDVRIITPHCGDKWFIHETTRSYYKVLIENGVKIYEYIPGFIHAKTYVSDDEYSVVGTINMDYRSLYLHFECGIWMYDNNSVIDIRDDFFHTLDMCRQITIEDIINIKWHKALTRAMLRIFAPLM